MNRTTMSYMVATIVAFAALGALTMQPTLVMAQPQQPFVNTAFGDPTTRTIATTTRTADPTTTTTTTNPACGQVVSGNVTLTSNLNCAGDGLIVGADHTVISLNGYSLSGPGKDSSKVGIMIPATSDVEVRGPGAINNFQAGVLMTGAMHAKVSTLIAQDNQIAIFMTGTRDTMVSENILKRNTIAIAAHSADGIDAETNILTGNALAGVTVVNTFGSTVSTNTIEGSTNGIFIDPQSNNNVVDSNTALKNVEDMNNANGLPTNINHNDYKNNNCQVSMPSGLCKGT
jgi:parallel beta-helix repeat protein